MQQRSNSPGERVRRLRGQQRYDSLASPRQGREGGRQGREEGRGGRKAGEGGRERRGGSRRGKEGFDVSTDLEDALVAHAKAFANAYPELVPKPKARFVFHIWLQLRRDAWIIDAFVGERKHIGVKSVGNDIDNTKVYVASVSFLLLPNKLLTWRSPPGKMM